MSNTKQAVTDGQQLREEIANYLQQHGPQTHMDLARAIKKDGEVVRAGLSRMIKAGKVKSDRKNGRPGGGAIAIYSLVDPATVANTTRSVNTPNRPVLTQWPACMVRDPFALPANFFGARAA